MRAKISYVKVVFFPLVLCFVLMAILISNYGKELERKVEGEYELFNKTVSNSIKVLDALNYSFVSHFQHLDNAITIESVASQQDGMCRLDPKNKMIKSTYSQDSKPILALDFSIKGFLSVCDTSSEEYKLAISKFKLAPIFSFLSRLDESIDGLYYISTSGYQLASPAKFNDDFKLDAIPIINSRNYWQQAQDNKNSIILSGPHNDFVTNEEVITLSAGVFNGQQFRGIVLLNLLLNKITDPALPVGSRIKLSEFGGVPIDGWKPYEFNIKGIKSTQTIYYQWSWKAEIITFIETEATALFGILALYLILFAGLIYIKIDIERQHFQELSKRDPMTNLLNRRGLEHAYIGRKVQVFEGLALFDIDNFKSVNDTYGHDKGDEVICFVADQLSNNTRNTDTVARFGGEEFVVYMQGNNADKMVEAIERLQRTITKNAPDMIGLDLTASAGFAVRPSTEKLDFDMLMKIADENLYTAKTTGKNKVVT